MPPTPTPAPPRHPSPPSSPSLFPPPLCPPLPITPYLTNPIWSPTRKVLGEAFGSADLDPTTATEPKLVPPPGLDAKQSLSGKLPDESASNSVLGTSAPASETAETSAPESDRGESAEDTPGFPRGIKGNHGGPWGHPSEVSEGDHRVNLRNPRDPMGRERLGTQRSNLDF